MLGGADGWSKALCHRPAELSRPCLSIAQVLVIVCRTMDITLARLGFHAAAVRSLTRKDSDPCRNKFLE